MVVLEERCSFCGRLPPKRLQCGNCRAASYCSKEHQTAHWKLHKAFCKVVAAARAKQPPPLPPPMRVGDDDDDEEEEEEESYGEEEEETVEGSQGCSGCAAQGPPGPSTHYHLRPRSPLSRFPGTHTHETHTDTHDTFLSRLLTSAHFVGYCIRQLKTNVGFFVPRMEVMGSTERRQVKRWVPDPGDVVCDACLHPGKVPTYYHSTTHWILCRECADGAQLRNYACGGRDEIVHGREGAHRISEECQRTQFPEYVGGNSVCGVCGGNRLLVLYDAVENEYAVCVDCRRWRQKLRSFDKQRDEMVDPVEPDWAQVADKEADAWVDT